jgi:hypothetical protein
MIYHNQYTPRIMVINKYKLIPFLNYFSQDEMISLLLLLYVITYLLLFLLVLTCLSLLY